MMPPLGRKIGSGKCRDVYIHGGNPKLVVKVLKKHVMLHNYREWEIWQKREDLHEWLLPILEIGERWIVTYKAKPIRRNTDIPNYPNWFRDASKKNWVHWKGKVVLSDYGSISMYDRCIEDGKYK